MTARKILKLTLEEYGYNLKDLIYPKEGLEMAIVEAMNRYTDIKGSSQTRQVAETLGKSRTNKSPRCKNQP